MKNALIGLFAAFAAVSSLADVTRDTEWYKIPDKAKVGAVVDLADTSGKADKNDLKVYRKAKDIWTWTNWDNPDADKEAPADFLDFANSPVSEPIHYERIAKSWYGAVQFWPNGKVKYSQAEIPPGGTGEFSKVLNFAMWAYDETGTNKLYRFGVTATREDATNETLVCWDAKNQYVRIATTDLIPLVDSTLTNEGQAADAKAVGDSLNEKQGKITANGILKSDGSGNVSVAVKSIGKGETIEGYDNTKVGDYRSPTDNAAHVSGFTAWTRPENALSIYSAYPIYDKSRMMWKWSLGTKDGKYYNTVCYSHENATVLDLEDPDKRGVIFHTTRRKFATKDNVFVTHENIINLENSKANKATTLSGYGITDGVTKTYVDGKISSTDETFSNEVVKVAQSMTNELKTAMKDELDPSKWVKTNETVIVKSHAMTTYSPTFVDEPPEQVFIKSDGTRNFEIYFPDNDSVRELLPIGFDVDIEGDVKKIGKVWTEKITKLPAILTMREPEDKTLLATVQYFD